MLSQASIQALEKRLQSAIDQKVFPGCVLAIVGKNGQRNIIAVGHHTYNPQSREMDDQSIFDIASITKVIPTCLLALQLIESGKLNLEAKVTDYLPEITSHSARIATIQHLLTYTYILKLNHPLSAFRKEKPETILNTILKSETAFIPGTKFIYTNTPSILLGLIIERVLKVPLTKAAQDKIFSPLQMDTTSFQSSQFDLERIVPTEIDSRGVVQGFVHDESSWALQKAFYPGCSGVFSTGHDLLNFIEMILHNGQRHGQSILKPSTIEQIETNQLANIGSSHGLGMELNQPHFMGSQCSSQTIGKTGFTGTSIVIDRKKQVGFVFLSNRTFPKRPNDGKAINQARHAIADMVWSTIK